MKKTVYFPPLSVQNNARKGLILRQKYFKHLKTKSIEERAKKIEQGISLNFKEVQRVALWFHYNQNKFGSVIRIDQGKGVWGDDSNPHYFYILWLLNGGNAGFFWSEHITKRGGE